MSRYDITVIPAVT